jgi:hypothetical protein
MTTISSGPARNRETYTRYMNSKTWAAVKVRAFRKYGRQCAACGSTKDLHMHHRTYERFTAEWLKDLVPLCEECHTNVHQYHAAVGGLLSAVTDKYVTMSRSAGVPGRSGRSRVVPPPLPARSDGKRVVSMDRRARGARADNSPNRGRAGMHKHGG